MNLDELRSVQRAERQRDSLQHLRDSFYADVASYLRQLKDERQRAVEAAEDPFASPDVRQLTDEIETAKEIANAVYERRVGKVVKLASFSAAEMETDEDGMTAEEQELFDDLVARIRRNRETVLSTLDGTAPSSASDPLDDGAPADSAADSVPADTPDAVGAGLDAGTDTQPSADQPRSTRAAPDDTPHPGEDRPAEVAGADADPGDDGAYADADLLSDALGDGPSRASDSGSSEGRAESERPTDEAAAVLGEPSSTGGQGSSAPETATERSSPSSASAAGPEEPDRTTVRITADVGSILGVDDVEYDLAREDVVMLPTTNAEPLIERDAAERFD